MTADSPIAPSIPTKALAKHKRVRGVRKDVLKRLFDTSARGPSMLERTQTVWALQPREREFYDVWIRCGAEKRAHIARLVAERRMP